jgi:hypothetical protein
MTEEIQTGYSDTYIIREPRTVEAGRGAGWFVDGFEYFRKAPLQWLAVCIVGFIVMIAVGLIPLVGFFSGILAPVWSAGLMLGCKDLHEGKPLQVRHLFAGFGDKVGQLILSGLLLSFISLVIVLTTLGPLFFQLISGNAEELENPDVAGMGISVLLMFAMLIPVSAAGWFSPALIILGNKGVIEALKLSLVGAFRNIVPFLIYGVLGILLTIPVGLTFGLGLLVVAPMFISSIFISFREIFVEE